jgi:hypothetical protein
MANIERRPHLQRACPFREQAGCDWIQTTSWFMGGPDLTQAVDPLFLRAEAEAHFMNAHFRIPAQYFV